MRDVYKRQVQDGNVVRSVTLCPSAKLHLEVESSRTALREKDTYDMAADVYKRQR